MMFLPNIGSDRYEQTLIIIGSRDFTGFLKLDTVHDGSGFDFMEWESGISSTLTPVMQRKEHRDSRSDGIDLITGLGWDRG